MKTNSHRRPATSATSIRRRNGAGKDEFHLVPFVPLWRANDGKRKLARLCFGWTAEAGERGSLITDAVERVPTGVHCAIRDRQSEIAAAFTRAELLITLAVLSLLVAIVLPALAHDRARSARIICANNLRQIGAGFQLWGNDHGDRPPWEVTPAEGGTKLHPLGVNAWLHFSWISNELNSARVLLCPSDSGRLADDFSFKPVGGYLNATYQNNATSYFLSHSGRIGLVSLMAGDRNVGSDGAAGCGWFGEAWNIITRRLSSNFQWNSQLHNSAGNLLRSDGSIEQSSNQDLRDALLEFIRDDSGAFHFLKPR